MSFFVSSILKFTGAHERSNVFFVPVYHIGSVYIFIMKKIMPAQRRSRSVREHCTHEACTWCRSRSLPGRDTSWSHCGCARERDGIDPFGTCAEHESTFCDRTMLGPTVAPRRHVQAERRVGDRDHRASSSEPRSASVGAGGKVTPSPR
jgi:hypothetical protein